MELQKESLDNVKRALSGAKYEIQDLRRRNEVLSAKVEVFDSMMCLLHTQARYPSQGSAPCVVHEIERCLKELS